MSDLLRAPAPAPTGTVGTGRLVAVEGIDASGKSTFARQVVAALVRRGRPAVLLDRATAPAAAGGYAGTHLQELRHLIWEYPEDAPTSQLGFDHWAHLLASWFAALDHTVIRPALDRGAWVVADPWYHKFAARFALRVGLEQALAAFAGITAPGSVVWLDVDPAVCAARRSEVRSTEAGEWQGNPRSRAAFVDYQGAVRGQYAALAAVHGWHAVTAPAPDADEVVDALVADVERERGGG